MSIAGSSPETHLISEAGTWYHVAGTWSGNDYAIYVNGVEIFSGNCTPQTTLSNTLPVQIGRHGSWSWVYFNGIIDEVKIYNYARMAGEIQADANYQQPPPAKTLTAQLHGAFDYLSSENTKPKITALVTDAVTSDLVQGANVEMNITGPDGSLWTTGVMTETSSGIYTWESSETAQQMSSTLGTGVYVVTVGASYNSGPKAYAALEFHIDPPAVSSSPSYVLPTIIGCITALIAIATGTLIYTRKKKSQ